MMWEKAEGHLLRAERYMGTKDYSGVIAEGHGAFREIHSVIKHYGDEAKPYAKVMLMRLKRLMLTYTTEVANNIVNLEWLVASYDGMHLPNDKLISEEE